MSATATGRTAAEVREERDFLLRSIEDLEREHAAGDVDAVDFAALRSSYVERAAATLRELAELEQSGAETGSGVVARDPARRARRGVRRTLGRRSVRRFLIALGSLCLAGLVLVAAAHAAGVRLPGQSATGTITLPKAAEVREELAQAQVLAGEGNLKAAINLYDEVLAAVPDQAEALAYKGWFVRLLGIEAKSRETVELGDATLSASVHDAPSYALARAFYGIALLEDSGDRSAALEQFHAFLADHPATALLNSVGAKMAAAFVAARDGVPAPLRRFEPRP